ncbi:MAG: protein translocase subunit SecD [Gemmatimonadetes bacterium]|uniref:Protein translocase subunit SecD n=1 Tax=Candidatus Kutchimonas denitrificans TaxID=3056748 RepID=A0AAE5CBL0_9BACT|nr:protein translocase subunit SecD [Gemmatimonadota bacterium]NIR76022.1 protein translocase subunit SecD [Candidatus Kutchimonas denitrificans]NIS02214.1 protein translocase subunit SecD [Gemmatimonadota bacterium]NIT68040.1 protein translocase subunit SecD [Gemmatimonadota bacterium]NIU54066.1 protein translocase subunit SecD [Gemmatimonadota bacterium]
MFSGLRGRLLVIFGVCLLCLWALLGPVIQGSGDPPLKLGLDLQGGTHLVLQVADPDDAMSDDARTDAANRAREIIMNRINQFGVREPTIQRVGLDRIIVELAGIQDVDRAKSIIEQTAFLEFKILTDGADFVERLSLLDSLVVAAVGAEEIPEEARVEPGADQTIEELFQQQDTAVAEPTEEPETELRPLTTLLLDSGEPGIFLVEEPQVETVQRYLELPRVDARIPDSIDLVWGADSDTRALAGKIYRPLYVVESRALITGEYLTDAQAIRDPQYNQPIVPFQLTRQGGRIFERGTANHVGDRMAIILDDRVQGSPPVIRDVLRERAQIELGSGATLEQARDLALVLRAGALPAPMEIIEERTVGPSLGQDSIDQGEVAGIIGLVLVVVVMIGYYRFAGTLAVLGLMVYVLIVLGGLAGLQADLTLPGIAGLILSVGMAVDANVLIFERIREELAGGKTARTATDAGFQNALSAIIDSNLTTLITALILYQFGTGPVKGFAVTLSIGIVASFFSAVFVVRTFMLIWLDRRAPTAQLSI